MEAVSKGLVCKCIITSKPSNQHEYQSIEAHPEEWLDNSEPGSSSNEYPSTIFPV